MTKITKKIDDAIDSESPEEVARADFSMDDDGVCKFLKNRKYVPASFLQTIERLADCGLITRDIGNGYGNLFCEKVYERAQTQSSLAVRPDPDVRLIMAQQNLEFASVFGCFFFGMIKPLPAGDSRAIEVTPSTIKKAYPDIYTINSLGQILDDLRDLMIDLEDEIRNKRVSPNIFLAHALQSSQDYNALEWMQRQVERYKIETIHPRDFPETLKSSFSSVGELFFTHASNVSGFVSRTILESFWHNTVSEGINTSFHHRVRHKVQLEAARYAAFE